MIYKEISTQCGLSLKEAEKQGVYRIEDTEKRWQEINYKHIFDNDYNKYLAKERSYIKSNHNKYCFIKIIKK